MFGSSFDAHCVGWGVAVVAVAVAVVVMVVVVVVVVAKVVVVVDNISSHTKGLSMIFE